MESKYNKKKKEEDNETVILKSETIKTENKELTYGIRNQGLYL